MEMIPSLFLTIITFCLLTCPLQSSSSGFSIDLIHRDSPLSPYYNSSKSYYEILRNSIRRSITRSSHILTPKLASSHPPTIQSPLTADPGEYLMKISLGTPSVDRLAIADTGSDLIWTQCKPCIKCYKQISPYFDPKKSSTYKKQSCHSKACRSLGSTSCDDKNFCIYRYGYGDGSSTEGDLSFESFTFESTSGKLIVLPRISFGCGHINDGNDNLTTGIVGLGNGELSLVNQFGNTINRKFSYCMVPLTSNVSSKISFGSKAVVSGSGVQRTPFFTKKTRTFYILNLKSVSIGDTDLKYETESYMNNATYNDDGNIIIDSGTTLSFLPSKFYQMIEDEFKGAIPSKPLPGPGPDGLKLCYKTKNVDLYKEMVPKVTFHFTGADLELGVLNTMVEVVAGVTCLAMFPNDGDPAILGNVQQMNYLVGYDLESKTVSFKKTDCTKYQVQTSMHV